MWAYLGVVCLLPPDRETAWSSLSHRGRDNRAPVQSNDPACLLTSEEASVPTEESHLVLGHRAEDRDNIESTESSFTWIVWQIETLRRERQIHPSLSQTKEKGIHSTVRSPASINSTNYLMKYSILQFALTFSPHLCLPCLSLLALIFLTAHISFNSLSVNKWAIFAW